MSVHSSTKELPNFDHSFLDLLSQGFENFPNSVCCQSGSQILTYAEVDTLSAKIANQLIQSGFEVGFKGAIYSLNSVETLIATVGVIRAGGVWVPINPRNSLKDNLGVLERFEVSALFY
ncbi:MAG: AMP-binding protein, partial [Halieaceae bacterium]